MSDNPIRIWDYVPVIKYNPNHGSNGQFSSGGGGGGGGGGGAPEDDMNSAVNGASSLVIASGGTPAMKDEVYGATKEISDAKARIASGNPLAAKEYMDGASDRLQRLPEMAEKAGMSSAIVDKLSDFANSAWNAHQSFYSGLKP